MISDSALQSLYRHACTTYPEECCGFVFANGSVHLGRNIQNELHQRNPEVYQRTAANGYTFSVADTVMMNQSFMSTNPVAVIYHSHPDVGAYFSNEDQDKALFMGKPVFPVRYLVIDCKQAVAVGAKLFEWDGKAFVCSHEFS